MPIVHAHSLLAPPKIDKGNNVELDGTRGLAAVE